MSSFVGEFPQILNFMRGGDVVMVAGGGGGGEAGVDNDRETEAMGRR